MPQQRVQEVAKKKNWSSAMDLVRKASVSTSTAYQIWNDPNYMPSVQVLVRIAKALDVSVNDLLLDDPQDTSNV